MYQSFLIKQPIDSMRALELYLEEHGFRIAVNTDKGIDAADLIKSSMPDWKKNREVPGCLILFRQMIVTKKKDRRSPIEHKIVPSRASPKLHQLIAGMCAPYPLAEKDTIPADTVVYVKSLNAA